MFRMDAGALRSTLQQLLQATHDHEEWRESLVRTLVCRHRADPEELHENAHHRCRFGQWYYGEAAIELRCKPVFASMEAEHKLAHAIAARLLRTTAADASIAPHEYDDLVAVCARLRLELDSLRHEIQDILRSTDPLTGAYGRRRLLDELREWRALAQREVQPCCIAFMDVDGLKRINDSHGHAVGDRVLVGAVQYVIDHLRPYDKVFRYGGDEFLITLPGTDLPTARHLIERVHQGFGRTPFVVGADGTPIHATASFGVAQLEPDISVEESIHRADQAVLHAKATGRNRVVAWEPHVQTGTRLAWASGDVRAG